MGFIYSIYFNSHAHVERDRLQDYKLYSRWYFNSHAHVERDMTLPSWQGSSMTFQLTRSRGAWLVGLADEVYKWNFNSHAHVERDAPRRINRRRQVQFQLTRSRGAWQYEMEAFLARYQFQLTRSRGAWRIWRLLYGRAQNFNSHAHVERDSLYFMSRLNPITFQLTRSRGAWRIWRLLYGRAQNFNSHAHVERDYYHRALHAATAHFNSHAHVERDIVCYNDFGQEIISTHTLTWSVT